MKTRKLIGSENKKSNYLIIKTQLVDLHFELKKRSLLAFKQVFLISLMILINLFLHVYNVIYTLTVVTLNVFDFMLSSAIYICM